MMQFCRHIYPGASLLIADYLRLGAADAAGSPASLSLMADRLADVIKDAMASHRLSLVPVIAIGRAEGADLALYLGLAHGQLLAACILLWPATTPPLIRPAALEGVHVLLVQSAAEESPDIGEALKQAGAQVICELVPNLNNLGSAEAAIARVFMAALFRA
jgi:predicted esterase